MGVRLLITIGVLFVANSLKAGSLFGPDSLVEGVRFETGLSWNQILAKAKREHKYIFVDCYASWCAPCKKMEKDVYSRRDVGERFNDQFICVKAQLDSSKNDDLAIRDFYPSAHYIGLHFGIQAYPTLLFFNADGNILKKVAGAVESEDFVKLADDVQDPQKDYYALLDRYKKGRRNVDEMGYLARTSIALLGDSVQAVRIAKAYMSALKGQSWFERPNIEFMKEFTHNETDPGFDFFYRNADTINNIMKTEGYSQEIVQGILYREYVSRRLEECVRSKTSPDWQAIALEISRKYDQYYVDRIIIGAKADWYGTQKDWQGHTKYLVLYVERYAPKLDNGGQFEALYLNNSAWDIFIHSTDSSELEAALRWSRRAVMMDPAAGWMDTYANILYKLRFNETALKWEAVAATLGRGDRAIMSNFESMREGKPTWPVK